MTMSKPYFKPQPFESDFSVVRALGQFGPMARNPQSVRLFLDDARNPPLKEKDWVVVRTVMDGQWFLHNYSTLVTEVSLDNDLGPDPQGYELLEWILDTYKWNPKCFPQLKKITIHTGNLPKWRKMILMLKGFPFSIERRVPTDRIYPRADRDTRQVIPYVASDRP